MDERGRHGKSVSEWKKGDGQGAERKKKRTMAATRLAVETLLRSSRTSASGRTSSVSSASTRSGKRRKKIGQLHPKRISQHLQPALTH